MSRMKSRRLEREEAGAILVYVALIIPVLFAAAAISVDVARWYVEVQRVQRAADAAALAAAPFVPGPIAVGSRAYNEAEALIEANGFSAADNNMAPSKDSFRGPRRSESRLNLRCRMGSGGCSVSPQP